MKYLSTKLLIIFIALIIGLLSFQSCETDSILEPGNIKTEKNTMNFNKNSLETYQTFENNKFQFKAINKENIISSKFSIKNKKGDIIYETVFNLDTSIKNYKLYQVEKVVDIANSLNYRLILNDYIEISRQYKVFIDNIISQYKNDKIKPLLGSLFFHNSILNYKKRSLEEKKVDCDCTLHPGYLLGKTGFFCQEDYLMSVNIIKGTITKNKDAFSNPSSLALTKYLNSSKIKLMSFDKLYEFYVNKKLYLKTLDLLKNGGKDNQAKKDCAWWCPLGCGSDWGCCGNYTGCCLYTNNLCFIHDAICTNCTYDACFSGCIPD